MTLADLFAEHGPMMTVREAAQFLGVSIQRVQELADTRIIRRFHAGRAAFYLTADLQAWKDRRDRGDIRRGRGYHATPVYEVAA